MWRRTEKRPHWQHQVATPQIAHDRLGAAQLPELGKHQSQPLLNLFVRIEGDTAVTIMDQPGGKRQPQFAARRLLALSLYTHLTLPTICSV
jgi:hypothetical protein